MRVNVLIAVVLSTLAIGAALVFRHSMGSSRPEPSQPSDTRSGTVLRGKLWLTPRDLSSATGASPIGVRLFLGGAPVGQAVMTQVAGALRLVDSAGEAVAVSVAMVDASVGARAVASLDKNAIPTAEQARQPIARVDLVPIVPLRDEEYTLELFTLPLGFEMRHGLKHRVRFNPYSRPLLSELRLCRKGGALTTVSALFSEDMVAAGGDGGNSLRVDIDGVRCSPGRWSGQQHPIRVFSFSCVSGKSISEIPENVILNGSGLVSAFSGMRLRNAIETIEGRSSRTWDEEPVSGDCRVVRPL